MNSDLKHRFLVRVDDLLADFGSEYLLFALKKISDRQLLFLDTPDVTSDFFPILKVLDIITGELESELFSDPSSLPEDDFDKQLLTLLKSAVEHVGFSKLIEPS